MRTLKKRGIEFVFKNGNPPTCGCHSYTADVGSFCKTAQLRRSNEQRQRIDIRKHTCISSSARIALSVRIALILSIAWAKWLHEFRILPSLHIKPRYRERIWIAALTVRMERRIFCSAATGSHFSNPCPRSTFRRELTVPKGCLFKMRIKRSGCSCILA
jgi:hypothetical protein